MRCGGGAQDLNLKTAEPAPSHTRRAGGYGTAMPKPILPGLALLALLSACGSGQPAPDTTAPDTTRPQVSLVGVPASASADTLRVRAEASDDVGVREVRFFLNGAQVEADSSAPYEANLTFAQNGEYVLRVEAVDTAGNVSEARTQTITVTADRAVPTAEVTVPGATLTAPGRYTITAPGSYAVTVRASDDVALAALEGRLTLNTAAGTFSQDINLPVSGRAAEQTIALPELSSAYNGTHTLTLQAVDAAGRRSTPVTVTLTVALPVASPTTPPPTPGDTEKPALQIVVPTERVTQAGLYRVRIVATDNVGVTRLTGSLSAGGLNLPLDLSPQITEYDIPVSAALNGPVTLTVTAFDAAGNSTTTTRTIVVAIP